MFDHWPDGRDGEGFRGGAMKAWQFEGEGKPISLNEIPEPRPGPGEVVIDVKAAGLCHSDLMYMEVGARTMPFLPMTQGHENAGIVPAPVSYTHLRAHETRHDL